MKLKDLCESTGKSVADLNIEYYRGGDFYCSTNGLTSLEGVPSHVDGGFYCDSDKLTSLEGAPSHVGGDFSCSNNKLTSLAGAPSHVGCSFYCAFNKLTSLKDVHKHITEIKGKFYAFKNPINSHVLGLLLIRGVTEVRLDNKQVEEILNRHLGKGRVGMLMAQEDLIEAGLEEFAQL
jgi:hypothetical protein